MIPNVNVPNRDTHKIYGDSDFAKYVRAVTNITKADSANYTP